MDMNYARAYMKERLDQAHAHRLAAEVSRVGFDDVTARRRGLEPAALGQRLDPNREALVSGHSPPPVCCAA
ncbi:MAG: hypothetical protein PVJ28_08480 [Acidimicrobiia bacterium]|jgi:hypothetical protein